MEKLERKNEALECKSKRERKRLCKSVSYPTKLIPKDGDLFIKNVLDSLKESNDTIDGVHKNVTTPKGRDVETVEKMKEVIILIQAQVKEQEQRY